ncbi:MAG: C40 family peptidase [Dokdonella sp.]
MSKLICRQKLLISLVIFITFGCAMQAASASSISRLLPAPDLFAALSPSSAVNLLIPGIARPVVTTKDESSDVVIDAHSAVGTASHVPAQVDVQAGLIELAMDLRNVRYRRGGRSPKAGFDCSGFVSYVFLHSLGLKLPATSASQFLSGIKVRRDDMRSGDLVFFRTSGKKRISHVGIYLDDGRFIHAPSSGKVVRIDSLDETYWAKRFAGAKRPDGIALG